MSVNEIEIIADKIQNESHEYGYEFMARNPDAKISPQAITNVFIFKKLAEFEYRLKQLETSKSPNQ